VGNAGGGRGILRTLAIVAILSVAGCVGSSLEETPQAIDTPPPQAQGAISRETPQSPASEDPTTDDSADDAAPVTRTGEPSAAPAPAQTAARFACRQPAPAGHRACDAIVAPFDATRFAGGAVCSRTVPYCAADLQSAYAVTAAARNGGKNALVGVVAAYGYSTAASDLAIYRRNMGLPACAFGNGCLRIVNQSGRAAPLPKSNGDAADDWRAEEALDLDVVSAICPNCKLLLVQANSDKSADLAASVSAAVGLGAASVVNGYGGKEENANDPAYSRAGRAIVASGGSGVRAPCSYAAVVCVGGTSLVAASSSRGWIEHPWHASGGCSAYVAKPAWQHVKGCKRRAVVDLAAVADPATGVAVYELPGGWQQMGGTGIGAAVVGALFAMGPSAARANASQWIWRHGASAYRRIDGAKNGYDESTGWGTPNGVGGF
jgi:hypothetical protein